jgi:large subunit ribosomal protein L9
MARNIELLLLETVESLGIIGDVVKVKSGYARNYLLPNGVAEPPSPRKIDELKEQRAQAQTELAAVRTHREKVIEELVGASISMDRSCNDQGALYGSVTQREISDALIAAGFGVDVRAVRMSHPIRHIGEYHVPIQFDKDLRSEVTVTIKADRVLDGFNEAGEPIETEDEPEIDESHLLPDPDERPRRKRRRG